ncbi:MAG: type II secretion system protein GspJ [Candidatus Omnitrophota bacterium]
MNIRNHISLRQYRQRAVTLVELLIATSIFSIIILSLYSAFNTGVSSYGRVDSSFTLYQTARIALNRITVDIANTFAYAKSDSRFKGDAGSVELFSIVDIYEKTKIFPKVCRVRYELSGGVLTRACYKELDALVNNAEVKREEIAYDVKDVSFEFAAAGDKAGESYQWQELWPKDEKQKKCLPLAVRIKLTLIEKVKAKKSTALLEFDKIAALPIAVSLREEGGE